MAETPQEYRARILANSQGQDPLKIQAATADRLEKLIKGVPSKRLSKNPAPGKWSVKEILAHLGETEIVLGFRIRLIRGANGTPILGFNQDDWARVGDYHRRDPKKSIALFRAVRQANLDVLKSLKPDEWKQYGMHSERGEESLETIARLIAGHDLNHIRQVEAILGPSGGARKKSRR
jgi:hypothetical protein